MRGQGRIFCFLAQVFFGPPARLTSDRWPKYNHIIVYGSTIRQWRDINCIYFPPLRRGAFLGSASASRSSSSNCAIGSAESAVAKKWFLHVTDMKHMKINSNHAAIQKCSDCSMNVIFCQTYSHTNAHTRIKTYASHHPRARASPSWLAARAPQ